MKQVIVVRSDLKLPKGKLAAQVAHASVDAALNANMLKVHEWRRKGAKKIVLKIKGKDELLELAEDAAKEKLNTAIIRDAGKTVVKPGTITCIAIGPDKEEKIDKITEKLKPL
ncbi:MAG: Peptidyl-tRNA hydrolase [Candidatus Woesearchaeota archaeon]|nr:Peptidyl-tRNA hydrolase [Candidatus Woesearchaeota archaeon]